MGPDEWSDVSAWFIRGWITSWTARTSEGIARQVRFTELRNSLDFRFDYRQSKANRAAHALSRSSSEEPGLTSARTSSLRYFSSGIHPRHFDSRTRCARPSSFHFFNSGDALQKKTSKPRIRAEMLDGWEDVEGILHRQGLSYVPEIIWTELTSRHHDEGTLALRKLEDSLPGKSTRPAVTTYRLEEHELRFASSSSTGQFSGRNYWWILGGIAYVYQLEKHKSRLRQDGLFLPIGKTQAPIWFSLLSTALQR